jgi:hypothetical protein
MMMMAMTMTMMMMMASTRYNTAPCDPIMSSQVAGRVSPPDEAAMLAAQRARYEAMEVDQLLAAAVVAAAEAERRASEAKARARRELEDVEVPRGTPPAPAPVGPVAAVWQVRGAARRPRGAHPGG